MPDLTPHLGAIVDDLTARLTLAGVGISSVVISPAHTGNEILLHPRLNPGESASSIESACRIMDALAASRVDVGRPYGDIPQVNVDGTVELAGHTVTVGIIAAPDPEPSETPAAP